MKAKKRMKMIPHCYRKRGPRNPSNYSLSQLLEIGAFKKQINDLKTNNRLLSNALQESRIEAASQSNLLKDYARDTNQILFARIKLHEMAKNLAKFASDLEEVRNCLDVGLPAEYNLFQKKGSSTERIIKVPDVSCIEEEPELFESEDSHELSENTPDVSESILAENVTSVNHDIEMTPILFPDDVQEIKKKRSGSVDKGSLTPQLNIDLVCFKQKRSTRSREKTPSLGRKRSTSRGLVTQINVVSTPQMPQIQDLVEMNEVLKSPSPLGRKRSTSRGLVTQVNAVSPPQMCQAHDPVEVSQILKSPSIRRKRSMSGGLFTHIDAVSPPQISQEQNPVEMSEVLKSPSPGREKSKSRGLVVHINDVSPTQMPQEQNSVEISEALKSPSPGKKRSRSRRLVTHINAVSPPQMLQEQNPVEISEAINSPSPVKKGSRSRKLVTHINDVSPPQMHQVQDPIEMNKIVIKIPLENLSNAGHGDSSMIQSFDLILNDKESDISNIDLNQPSKINEICPLQPQSNDNNSPVVAVLEDNSEVHTHVQEKKENFVDDVFYPENNLQKLTDISQNTSSALNDVQLPEINEYDAEIQNVGSLTFCDSDEDENDDQKKSPVSPLVRSSRSKKPVKFTDFFLSDEDDTDCDSPFKLPVTKRYGNKKIKLYSTSTGKSCEKTSTENADEISSVAVKEIAETDYSVYNLDVSNSKKAGKKHKKKPSAKSLSKKLNDKPKPLFQKCSVVKLKGGKLKFSKCEKATEQKSIDKPPEKSMQNSCVSPGGILKRSSLMLTCEDKKHETPLKEIRNIDNLQDSKQQNMLQTPKRVSFAPTDLICKFQKMSESKAIADNKKVRRTSKSAIDLKELFEKADQSKTPPAATGNSSENTDVQNPGSVLFNLSDDTEMYTFTFPSNIQYPSALPIDDVDTSKPPTPKITDKKVKRSSRSAIDLKELVEKTDQFMTPPAVTSTSSENKNAQKPNSIPFDFFADTEQILILSTDDIVTSKTSISKISDQAKLNNMSSKCLEKSPTIPNNPENIEKLSLKGNDIADKASSENSSINSISSKCIEKSPMSLNSPKNIQKLSLKRNKIVHKTAPECNSNIISVSETAREITDILLLESPVSLVKAPKRKSLFKESPDGCSKENLNIDQLVTVKKDSLKNKKSTLSTPKVGIKKSSCSKSQTKVHSKVSAKKNKKSNLETKSVEQSPVLADATNTIVESHSRRRSKQVSYKEPSLNKKVRRGDTFFQTHT